MRKRTLILLIIIIVLSSGYTINKCQSQKAERKSQGDTYVIAPI